MQPKVYLYRAVCQLPLRNKDPWNNPHTLPQPDGGTQHQGRSSLFALLVYTPTGAPSSPGGALKRLQRPASTPRPGPRGLRRFRSPTRKDFLFAGGRAIPYNKIRCCARCCPQKVTEYAGANNSAGDTLKTAAALKMRAQSKWKIK